MFQVSRLEIEKYLNGEIDRIQGLMVAADALFQKGKAVTGKSIGSPLPEMMAMHDEIVWMLGHLDAADSFSLSVTDAHKLNFLQTTDMRRNLAEVSALLGILDGLAARKASRSNAEPTEVSPGKDEITAESVHSEVPVVADIAAVEPIPY